MRDKTALINDSLLHLNGNLLCAVDCETSGLDCNTHDLIEIAVVPLNSGLRPMSGIKHFEMILQLKRPQNLDPAALTVNKMSLAQIELQGIDPWLAADLFEKWFYGIGLTPGKKISPLAQNWPFDRGFITEWLGQKTMDVIFDRRFRDTMVAASFINDRLTFQLEKPIFPKQSLGDLCNVFGIKQDRSHRALDDALTTAEIYRHMMSMFLK